MADGEGLCGGREAHFQLPLSGSLVGELAHMGGVQGGRFQLPLSGSPTLTAILTTVAGYVIFQLPLSGSPSPIPGFFGSPRRPAAAPLRTNES